jgi:hypothetical protein
VGVRGGRGGGIDWLAALAQDGIKRTYSEKIRPVEMMYGFEAFRDVATDSEFEAKPSVLLIGQ